MKAVTGLDLGTLVKEADEESKQAQAKEIKRFVVTLNTEIINRTLEVQKLEAKLAQEKDRLNRCVQRREKIAQGDWSAVTIDEGKEEK